jgi:hypothetical protein
MLKFDVIPQFQLGTNICQLRKISKLSTSLKVIKQRNFAEDKELSCKAGCVFHVGEYQIDICIDTCIIFKLSTQLM